MSLGRGSPGAPTCCLLLGVSAAQQELLAALPDVRLVDGGDVQACVASCDGRVDVVVVGSLADNPVALVQRAHRAAPDAGVVVVPPPESTEQVRRSITYAPGVPLDVLVLAADAPLVDEVRRLRATVEQQRQHRELLAAVTSRISAAPVPRQPAVVALGALLEHAPLGVLVCDAAGGVLGWNRRASALVTLLPASASDVVLDELLPGAAGLVDGSAGPEDAVLSLTTADAVDVEISAVSSQLDDGRPVVLLLLVDVTDRRAAERARDRLAGHVALLASVSDSLTSTLDVTEALDRLSAALVPALADWVSIQLVDETGGLSVVVVRHWDPALADVVARTRERQAVAASDDAPSRRAARGGAPLLLADVDAATLDALVPDSQLRALFTQLGVSSVLAVPLPARGAVLGSLVLVNGPDSRRLSEVDVAIATEAGRRAGTALDNARLYSQQRNLSTELQRSLLTDPPQPDHAQIVVRYVAAAQAAQVGGDWYDAFVQPDGATVLVIGDVVGHDTRAAAGMSQLRGVLRGIGFTTSGGPAEVLTRLDSAIDGLLIATTATAVVARIEQAEDEVGSDVTWLVWSNAGHPPPVLLHPDGRVRVLEQVDPFGEDDADLLLGVDPSTPRRTGRIAVPRGSTLLLYTDGLVERRGQSLDDGIAALVEVLERHAEQTLDELCDTALRTLLPDAPEDDVALVAVRLHPQEAPRPPEACPERVPPGADPR